MLIVDAQVHIWETNTLERPWQPGFKPHRDAPFRAADLINAMNEANVDAAILVPPMIEGKRNDLALDAARDYPGRFAVMGRIDTSATDAREHILRWRERPGMLGLRFNFHDPEGYRALSENRFDWLWAAAEKTGVPIMLMLDPNELQFADHIAARYIGLKLVLDHLALPANTRGPAAFANIELLLALAKRPNIAVKASAMPAYASDAYPFRSLYPFLRRVYDAYGPKRVFWGTDYTRLQCTYQQAVDLFAKDIPWLTTEDREWIMGRGLCAWLGWQPIGY